jgi:Zn-finger nucleic acid-binding protein
MQCPVCKEVQLVMSERQNIEIDYCPQCRGVWLDRGELDKIIERSQHEESSFLTQNNSFATQGLSANVPQPPPLHSNHTEYMVRLASDTAGDLVVGIIRMTAGTVLATTHKITLASSKGCSIDLYKTRFHHWILTEG